MALISYEGEHLPNILILKNTLIITPLGNLGKTMDFKFTLGLGLMEQWQGIQWPNIKLESPLQVINLRCLQLFLVHSTVLGPCYAQYYGRTKSRLVAYS